MRNIFTLLILASLMLTSCSKETNPVIEANAITQQDDTRRLDPTDPGSDPCVIIKDLYAGQYTYVGTVTTTYDPYINSMTVVYNADIGWSFDESHFWSGDCNNLPTNKPGNPRIGQFPYKGTHEAGTTTITYVVENANISDCFSAHAVVSGPNGANETAWMEGIEFNDSASWAMYDSYDFTGCSVQ